MDGSNLYGPWIPDSWNYKQEQACKKYSHENIHEMLCFHHLEIFDFHHFKTLIYLSLDIPESNNLLKIQIQ